MSDRFDVEGSPPERRALIALSVAQGVLFAVLALARYATFHNETFDSAFYSRIAWGLVHGNFWEPLVDAHIYGLHLSPVLAPLGLLGLAFGTPTVLILAQSAMLAAASFPLARIGARHLGPGGVLVGAIAWLFHPNLGHVAAYEVHPGSMAALPLAWMAWAIDRGSVKGLVLGALGALACREDLALVTALAALLFAWQHRSSARRALAVAGISVAYALFFFLFLHPRYAPAEGSLQLHFGHFGDSPAQVVAYLITHPGELVSHLATPSRLLYLPKILAPLALLPLLRARWLLPAAPVLAINLISEWPTTTDLDVHYLTPALPFLVAGALDGAGRLPERFRMLTSSAIVVSTLVAHIVAGGTPLSLDFDGAAYRRDANSDAGRAIVAAIGKDGSVQAPDPLLPHLAERLVLHRSASPETGADYLVLDVAHRRHFAADEDLLRTVEEPRTRAWIARDDHRLVLAAGDYVLLERGGDPREGAGARAIVGRAEPDRGQRIAACLGVVGAELNGRELTLELVARGPCPSDSALRIGIGRRPRRVDLLFAGLLSPGHLREGDHLLSRHRLSAREVEAIHRDGLRVGALRSSGARPEHADPVAVDVPLR